MPTFKDFSDSAAYVHEHNIVMPIKLQFVKAK